MTEKLTTYDPATALVDGEEIAFFMADALKTSDAAYIAKALGVVARAKGLSKLSLQRIKTVVLLLPCTRSLKKKSTNYQRNTTERRY